MAPRLRKGQAPPPLLLALPDAIILRVLQCVSDRLVSAALVCKRLRELCLSPELLRELPVHITQARLERTQALLLFLASHAQHVRHLSLHIHSGDGGYEADEEEELAALVASCLAVCGAQQPQGRRDSAGSAGGAIAVGTSTHLGSTPGLQHLSICPDTPLATLGWLPSLRALRQLSLGGRGDGGALRLPLCTQLSALEAVHLSGGMQLRQAAGQGGVAPTGYLPPSLTSLHLEGDIEPDENAAHQLLAGLPGLRSLELSSVMYSALDMSALQRLTALTRLALTRVENFPLGSYVAPLTALVRLEVRGGVLDVDMELIDGMVEQMPQLTCLALDLGRPSHMELPLGIPSTITSLCRLQRFSFSTYKVNADAPDRHLNPRLPDGPWLACLRWLALPLDIALAGVAPAAGHEAPLAGARQLENFCIQPAGSPSFLATGLCMRQWATLWRWLATHPPLRRFWYEAPMSPAALGFDFVDGLLALQRDRPALQIGRLEAPADRQESNTGPSFWWEMLGSA